MLVSQARCTMCQSFNFEALKHGKYRMTSLFWGEEPKLKQTLTLGAVNLSQRATIFQEFGG